jgi:hypothetical protein
MPMRGPSGLVDYIAFEGAHRWADKSYRYPACSKNGDGVSPSNRTSHKPPQVAYVEAAILPDYMRRAKPDSGAVTRIRNRASGFLRLSSTDFQN